MLVDKHTRMSFSTTSLDPLADPLGTRRGPPLVRGPQFENRWHSIHRRFFYSLLYDARLQPKVVKTQYQCELSVA